MLERQSIGVAARSVTPPLSPRVSTTTFGTGREHTAPHRNRTTAPRGYGGYPTKRPERLLRERSGENYPLPGQPMPGRHRLTGCADSPTHRLGRTGHAQGARSLLPRQWHSGTIAAGAPARPERRRAVRRTPAPAAWTPTRPGWS
ncbi:hypothetical protein FRAAL6431 [Frankia alni ACN14a]|uniref:Uncharacterized protein n=1 Tax=Frankia alni (strain DSM 45986 / CECT 9034 / ACN14a) TaxID=326424 RepID=Q0RBX6_FRAAA|nr:hypothetical protein FRAAL6431 [Frankia alni ACN14a]